MMRNWMVFESALAVALALGGCALDQEDAEEEIGGSEHPVDVVVVPTGIDTAGLLGQGRDAITEEFRADCVRSPTTLTIPLQEANLRFDSSLSQEDLMQKLGYDIDAKARFKMISGSASAKFSRSLTAKSLSVGMFYAADYRMGIDRLDQANLQWLVSPDAPNWLTRCGDHFLSQREKGGQLFLLYRIDFTSLDARQQFEGSVGVSWPAGEVNAKVQQEANRFINRASVHVEAFQIGGDVTRLSSILGGGGPDASAGRVVLDCRMDNLGPCGVFLQNAINYASAQTPGSFSDTLRTSPADRTYQFKDWSLLGVPFAPRTVPAAVRSARVSLRQMFDGQVEFSDRVATLKSGRLYVTPALRAQLDGYELKVQTNLALLVDAASRCYDQLTNPADPAQISACTGGATLASLVASGYDTSLTMDKLAVDPRLPYVFGGIYQTTISPWPTRSDIPNPFTGTVGCPAGFTSYPYGQSFIGRAGGVFQIVAVEHRICFAPDTVAGGGWDFTGAFQLTESGGTMVANHFAGAGGGSCPPGTGTAHRFAVPYNGVPTRQHFCSTDTRSSARTTLGGIFSRDDQCGPSTPNPLTGTYGCPDGFSQVLIGRGIQPAGSCVQSFFACKAN